MSNQVKFEDLTPEEKAKLKVIDTENFEEKRFGEAGYLMPARYKHHADAIRAMDVRSDDLWLMAFPRSGSHMMVEMLWLLQNNLDYKKAAEIPQSQRSTYPEIFILHEPGASPIGYQILAELPSPRIINTHLAFSLLPPNLLDTAKVVYIARDPRDVVISYYHFLKRSGATLKQFWEAFINDLVIFSPFFSILKEAWAQRNHPNMLFMFYEDIIKDMPSAIRLAAQFLEKECDEEEVNKLSEHMHIDKMRQNTSVQPKSADSKVYVRQGKSGGWREVFDEEMKQQAEVWMQKNLADTGLSFPEH